MIGKGLLEGRSTDEFFWDCKLHLSKRTLRSRDWDFLGGPVVKNLPCNAEDTGSIPGWGTKIPHAVEHVLPLSP